ncbi:unnamed protein product [Blepharisma stoltei]|uniref:TNFR-Cys domain-containing protein n=1 Tax=Blepharisma stoltei TaxID=1481888 RepID=A0AAU9KM94_9CILI|nr:unnamed protein product [Blepharisma stoltei]
MPGEDDCTKCYSDQCPKCYGYSQNMCSKCTSGKEPSCCDWLASSCSSTFNSITCSIGTVLINEVCLYAIPYGFVNNLPVNTPVINADFTNSFAGIYDSILVTGESSSTYNYWNSPESIDPLPAKQRGLYFIPNSYLKATINLYHTFTIGAWVYPISGYYITYTGNQLKVHSNGTIEICMPNFAGSSKTYSTSISSNLQKWNYISYSIEYRFNGTSSISPYIETDITNPYFVQEGIFRPEAGGSLYLGSADFNGFISLFQLWQIAISSFQSYRGYFNNNAGALDLWSCDFNSFYDGSSFKKCLDSCQNGCVRADSCNICDSELCLKCSSFDSKSCFLCVENRLGNSCSFCTDLLCDTCNSSSNGCKACKPNASVQNNSCACNSGYNGTTACKYVPFSVDLLIFSNDSLSLDFSDPLQYALSNDSFKISIENDPKFSWSLELVNTTYYSIQTIFNEKIEEYTIINITFFDLTKVKSIYNGILSSSTISSRLNKYDPASYSLAMTEITSQISSAVQGAVIGSIAASFVNPNPSSLWSFLSCLQILSYLSLSGIPFSEKMNKFLSNLNSFSLFPNVFEYLINEKEGSKAYDNAINFGYNTDLILLNQGDDFSIAAASVLFIPLVLYLANCSYRMVGKKFQKMYQNYKYAFYIRFWIQCFLELGTAAYVGLKMFKIQNFTQITNIIICFGIISLYTASPFAFFWFSYRNRVKIQSKSKTFFSLFDSFFYEFRTEKGFLYSLYYFVYFLRRLIYSTNLVFLSDYPRTQVSINIICSLISIFYLIAYWPYKDKIIQISNLASEIMISIIMCATSFYLFDLSSSMISDMENFIIFTSIMVIGVQFCTSISIFARTIYQLFGGKLNPYGNSKLKVHPIEEFSETI